MDNVMYYTVITDPSDELWEKVTEFYNIWAEGNRNCDPDDYQPIVDIQHVKSGKYIMLLGRAHYNDEILSVFWVSTKSGEAVLPAYRDEFALEAIVRGLWEAQGHLPIQMWCAPRNPKNAEWILSTGMADRRRWEEEGIITWSPR